MAATIRRMDRADVTEVRDLVCRTVDISYQVAYHPDAIAFFKQYHSKSSIDQDIILGYAVVAIVEGRLVGTGTLLNGEIKRVFVDPAEQGRGHGGSIMRVLIAQAKAEGLRTVTLDASTVSRAIYEHLGFRPVRDGSHDLGGGLTLDYTQMALGL